VPVKLIPNFHVTFASISSLQKWGNEFIKPCLGDRIHPTHAWSALPVDDVGFGQTPVLVSNQRRPMQIDPDRMTDQPTRDKEGLSGAPCSAAVANSTGWTFQLEQAVIIQFAQAANGTRHIRLDGFFRTGLNFGCP
jgi:hypothetical protein